MADSAKTEFLPGQAFDLWIDPGDASTEDVTELLVAISELHRALGGSGLVYEMDGEYILPVGVEEE